MVKEFLIKEAEFLENLRKKYPDDVDYIKSFMESRFLSEKAVKELPLLEEKFDMEERKMFMLREAISAFNSFLADYYDAVGHLFCTVTGSDMISLDDLLNYLHALSELSPDESIFKEEPFFEWFVKEGIHHLNNIQRKLHVEAIEELAVLIRHLDYHGAYLSGYEDSLEEVLSFLYDIPIMLEEDLNQAGLLKSSLEVTPRPMMKDKFFLSITFSNRTDITIRGPGRITIVEYAVSFKEKPEVYVGGELIERSELSRSPDSVA